MVAQKFCLASTREVRMSGHTGVVGAVVLAQIFSNLI